MKQTAHNVADPEVLNNTADAVKSVLEETYKGYKGLKGVTFSIEVKDAKVVQDLEIDLSVASIDELRKAVLALRPMPCWCRAFHFPTSRVCFAV